MSISVLVLSIAAETSRVSSDDPGFEPSSRGSQALPVASRACLLHQLSSMEEGCPGAVEASTWGKIKAMFK
jgi:hypothetical protein